jgi:hypothetical protein
MDTYMNRVIENGVVYDEDSPGKVEVIVSIGEFEGIELAIRTASYEQVGLSVAAARDLTIALQDALDIHAGQPE